MDDLESFLTKVRDVRRLSLSGEEATRVQVVLPILARLGWTDSWETVPEYAVGAGRVDYCLKVGERDLVFIEVKRASEDLEHHQEQLLEYAFPGDEALVHRARSAIETTIGTTLDFLSRGDNLS